MTAITNFLKTHGIWLVIIGLSIIFADAWLKEHDARLQAAASVSQAQAAATALQQQITASNQTIATLQQQMAQNDARTQQQLQAISNLIAQVKTPQQVAVAIPQVTDNKVTPTAQSNGDLTIPSTQAVDLFQQLARGKQDATALASCTSDLSSQQAIDTQKSNQLTAQQGIIAQQTTEIAALQKKPSFWHRVGSTLKQVGLGFASGFVAGKVW